ncbi:MAG: RNA polymerase sigma factor [Desulfobacteraceae bacterium]|jgi:RNA polymerase sigma factor (sigma-70 family)
MVMMAEKEHSRLVNFFRGEYHRLVNYARRLLKDTAEMDGEDIVQDVILNLFNLADVTVPIDNLAAYFYQSLRNKVVDFLRKPRPQIMSLDETLTAEINLSLSDLIPADSGDALDEMSKKESVHQLFAAIELLNDAEKAVIQATEFDGRSFKELSAQWDVPLGTLLSQKSRALKKIKSIMTDFNSERYEKEK